MRYKRQAISAIVLCGLLGFMGALFWLWFQKARPQTCRLPDGSTLTLLGVTYGRHHLLKTSVRPNGDLWAQLRSLLHPQTTVYTVDTATDVLLLWVRMSRDRSGLNDIGFTSRVELADKPGDRMVVTSDTIPWMTSDVSDPTVRLLVMPTWPRGSRELTARLYMLHDRYTAPDATFHIANPAFAAVPSPPHWAPEPLPTTRRAGDISLTLQSVNRSSMTMQARTLGGGVGRSVAPRVQPWGQEMYGENYRVEAHFRLDSKPGTRWEISNFWISDLYGNLWRGDLHTVLYGPHGPQIWNYTYLTPVQMKGEALRYTVECSRGVRAAFPATEQWTLPAIEIPPTGKKQRLGWSHSADGITLKVLGVTGTGCLLLKGPPSGIPPLTSWSIPAIYVEVTGACRPYLMATDEQGRHLLGSGGLYPDSPWLKPEDVTWEMEGDHLNWHYSEGPDTGKRILIFPVQARPGTKRIRLTLVANPTRVMQFTVPSNSGLAAK